jgi:hypothetical protein
MSKITGKIQAEFTIKSGEVVAAEAKTGHPFLVKATTEALRARSKRNVYGHFRL